MKNIWFFLLTLLVVLRVATPALAESHPAGETPGGAASEINVPADNMIKAAAPTPLPDAPSHSPKVMDKKFIAVMAALGGAETLRFTTRKLVLDNEFAAGAPWVTSVPANRHLIAKYAPIFAAEFLVAYELKKSHDWLPGDKYVRKFWWVYPVVMTTIHIKNGVGNIRTQAPAGTTECPPEYQQYCGGQ